MAPDGNCPWCYGPIRRTRKNSTKTFCSEQHRNDFHSALRAWAHAEFADGKVRITDLRKFASQNGQKIKSQAQLATDET